VYINNYTVDSLICGILEGISLSPA